MRSAEDQNKKMPWLWFILTIVLVVLGVTFVGSLPQIPLLSKIQSGELDPGDPSTITPENNSILVLGVSVANNVSKQLFKIMEGIRFIRPLP